MIIATCLWVSVWFCELKALLEHKAKVYLAARSKEKADAAIADLKEATGREAIYLEIDLSSMDSVREAAKVFLRWVHAFRQSLTVLTDPSKERELHMLFNNACVP